MKQNTSFCQNLCLPPFTLRVLLRCFTVCPAEVTVPLKTSLLWLGRMRSILIWPLVFRALMMR